MPEGIRREWLVALLDGRLWPELRAAAIGGDGLPACWERAARWYRRPSREQQMRKTDGVVVATLLDELRVLASAAALRATYCGRDDDWVRAAADRFTHGEAHRADLRWLDDAAYGLRWLELAFGLRLDLRRSLAPQVPPSLLRAVSGGATAPDRAVDS